MHKSVLIGGSLGVLVLGLIAGTVWITEKSKQTAVSTLPPANSMVRIPPSQGHVIATPTTGETASSSSSVQGTQERRKRLADLRAEFNVLRAQGAQASPERMHALVDEMQAVAPSGFDPRYFQTLRSMLEANAEVQTLNKELQSLSKSNSPKDEVRRQEIIAKVRSLGERVSADARNLQLYAPATSSLGTKSP